MFDWLFGKKKAAPRAPEFLCSACYQVRPVSELRALPWWNSGAGAFLMSNRCPQCFPTSLEETVDRVGSWDSDAEAAFQGFLGIWKIGARFPEMLGENTQDTARKVLDAVRSSDGRLFASLAADG